MATPRFKLLFYMGLLSLPPCMSAQTASLQVDVLNVSSSEGDILIALYTEAATFLEFKHVYRTAGAPAKAGITRVSIEGLPYGEYALAVFHDENGNAELDTNFLGIPKEPLGFSNARLKAFGPPGFRECVFLVEADASIRITLE